MRFFKRFSRFVFLSCFLVGVASCTDSETTKAKYLSQAETFMSEENWPKARVALKNVLRIDPKDSEASLLRARVAEKEKDFRTAFLHYKKAVMLDPTQRDALNRLSWFYLAGNQLDKVEETADQVLAQYPEDVTAMTFQAAVLARRDHITEAISEAERLLKKHPKQKEVVSLLASLYVHREQPEKAAQVLLKAIKAHPQDVALLNDIGITYHRLGKTAEAEKVFNRIVQIEPDRFAHKLRLSRFYIETEQMDKAREILQEAARREPSDEIKHLALAEFLGLKKEDQARESVLLKAKATLPKSDRIRFALAHLYESNKRFSEARTVYQEILSLKKSRQVTLSAQVKLATLDWVEGEAGLAETHLKQILKETPRSAEALTLKGKIAMAQGDNKLAVQSFRSVLRDQPELGDIHILLGQAHLALEERTLARESLEKAVDLNRGLLNARRFLARLDFTEGSRLQAKTRLQGILKDVPQDLEALKLLVTLQVLDRAWPEALSTLDQMRQAGIDPNKINLAEGDLYQASEDWEKAIAAYERTKRQNPDMLDPLKGLSQVFIKQGKADKAVALLQKIISEKQSHPYAHGLLGDILLGQKKRVEAKKELELAARIKPDWIAPWAQLASLSVLEKKPLEAISVLERGIKANPESPELLLLIASMFEQTKQSDRAIETYETVLKQNPRLIVAENNLAFLLADIKGDTRSLEKALAISQAFEKRTSNPFYLDTLAWVYVKLGQGEVAQRLLKEVINKIPKQPLFEYHLGMAYFETGAIDQARIFLAKAVNNGKPFPGLEKARSTLRTLPQ